LITGRRVADAAQRLKDEAHIGAPRRIRLAASDGLTDEFRCRREMARLVSQSPQEVQRVRMTRVHLQNLAAARLGLSQVAGLQVLPGEGKQFRGCGHAPLDYRPVAAGVHETYTGGPGRVS
jgi:hypothetical protein